MVGLGHHLDTVLDWGTLDRNFGVISLTETIWSRIPAGAVEASEILEEDSNEDGAVDFGEDKSDERQSAIQLRADNMSFSAAV